MLSKLYMENVGIFSGESLEKESPDTLNDKAHLKNKYFEQKFYIFKQEIHLMHANFITCIFHRITSS